MVEPNEKIFEKLRTEVSQLQEEKLKLEKEIAALKATHRTILEGLSKSIPTVPILPFPIISINSTQPQAKEEKMPGKVVEDETERHQVHRPSKLRLAQGFKQD